MLKTIKISLITGCILASGAAMANSSYYVGGKLGVSFESLSSQKYEDVYANSAYNEYGNWGSKTKAAFNAGIQGGYNFKQAYDLPIRLELDYTYRGESKTAKTTDTFDASGVVDTDVKLKVKTTLHTIMFNSYYDIDTGTDFTPYLSAGLGLSIIDTKFNITDPTDEYDGNISKKKTNFAWSVGFGVSYNMSQNLDFDLGYRYLDAGKIKWSEHDAIFSSNTSISAKLATHDLSLGLRYSF